MIRIKKTAFTELSIADFGTKAQQIHDLMNNNPTFPSPSPALTELQTAITAYSTLVSAASNGDRLKINDRNTARSIITEILVQLASYVAYTVRDAENPRQLVESAGFEMAKNASHIGELPAPRNMESEVSGEPGAVVLKWETVYGAHSYVVEVTQESGPAATWNEVAAITKSKYKVPGLTPGQFYSFRVRAVGAAGYSDPSDITTSVVG